MKKITGKRGDRKTQLDVPVGEKGGDSGGSSTKRQRVDDKFGGWDHNQMETTMSAGGEMNKLKTTSVIFLEQTPGGKLASGMRETAKKSQKFLNFIF